jgi:glycerophosphoryl diester phosphodiesterase
MLPAVLLKRLLMTGAAVLAVASAATSAAAVTVSAHRGATEVVGVPENSTKAFYYAVSAGVAVLETDVRWTRDDVMVILHDNSLDRTTNCSGPVEAITYAALRRCAPAQVVPSFAAVLEYARAKHVLLNPELKSVVSYPFTAAKAAAYVGAINAYGMAERTVVSSFDTTVLALVRQQDTRGLRFALITDSRGPVTPAEARAQGTIYMPRHTTLTRELVDAYREAGLQVWAWGGANTEDEFAAMVALGVDVIVADDPRRATAYLRSHVPTS